MVACKILASSLQVETKSDGPLQWRYNERDGVSNHHPHDCLLNRLFRSRSKKTSKLRVTSLLVTGEFPAQRAELFPFDDITMQKTIILYHTWVWNRGICMCVIVRPRSHMLIVLKKVIPHTTRYDFA